MIFGDADEVGRRHAERLLERMVAGIEAEVIVPDGDRRDWLDVLNAEVTE